MSGPAASARRPRAVGKPSVKTLFPKHGEDLDWEHWDRRPSVYHGSVRRLGALVELDELSDFRRWPRLRELSITATLVSGSRYRRLAVDSVQAAQLFGVGATLSFNGAQAWHPTLGRWTRALAREFGLPADMCHCNVYLSPAGGGVPKHFDPHHVIVVHVIGAKIWSVSPNRNLVHPTDRFVASQTLPPELFRPTLGRFSRSKMPRRSARFEMRPGSVLSLPSGHWHATRATAPSLSVTFGLRTLRFIDLMASGLWSRLEQLADWRAPAWGASGTATQRAAAQKRLASLLLTLPGDLGELTAAGLLRTAFPATKTSRSRRR